MCGILGILDRRQGSAPRILDADLDRLRHRGPDGRGVLERENVALGHTRLSILDLSSLGAQPMTYAQGRYAITFNGEVYNYLELREELAAQGCAFTSRTDTEVILAAYQQYGPGCVERFRGMFAFAIWDERDKTLFLARDRCGERPLIYWQDQDRFCFASEFKGLLPLLPHKPALDPAVADMYLHFQYVPEPLTLLQGVRKLPASHTMTVRLDDWDFTPRRYWELTPDRDEAGDPPARIREELDHVVELTLRSDVPVGVALSGGIDSGAVAALAQRRYPEPMHAFSVGYPGRPPYDEREQARDLAQRLGMIFHEVELPVDTFVDFFPSMVRIMDEPIADPAAFGHYSVPKAAADLGIKVLLTGIGGDEVFWGYNWVAQAASINLRRDRLMRLPTPLRALAGRLARAMAPLRDHTRLPGALRRAAQDVCAALCPDTPEGQLVYMTIVDDFRQAFALKRECYGPAMAAVGPQNPYAPTAHAAADARDVPFAVLRILFDTWLASNCLSLGDRVGMAVSVETRLPFLDHRLIELAMRLRRAAPDHELGQKAWLRAALKGVLPDDVLTRPKRGFQPPVWEWLSGVVARYGSCLEGGRLEREGIVERKGTLNLLETSAARGWPGVFFAYKLVLLEAWAGQL